jgi:hypothetical protein
MRFVAVLRIDQNQCASMLTPQCIKQKHAESNVERNRAIRSFFDPTTRGTVGSSLSRQGTASEIWMAGIGVDAARFATEKPDPHRPAASSNLRGQADGTWTRSLGPNLASAVARHLARQAQQTSDQRQLQSR